MGNPLQLKSKQCCCRRVGCFLFQSPSCPQKALPDWIPDEVKFKVKISLSFHAWEPLIVKGYVPELLCCVVWVFLLNRETRLLVKQGNMSSCWTRRHVFLSTGGHVFLLSKDTCLPAKQEHMSSCWTRTMSSCRTRTHVFLFNNKICVLVQQEDTYCSTRTHVFLLSKNT